MTIGDSTPLTAASQVQVSASVYARDFGAELVLLDFGRGEYFGLDEVGTEIWRQLEVGSTLGAAADAVVARYDVAPAQALQDVLALVSHMHAQGLVTVRAA